MSEAGLTETIAALKPAMEACLDPMCVVDSKNRIAYLNEPMRELLGIKAKGKEQLCFCEVVKLAVCKAGCQVEDVLESGESVRFDETPASRGSAKLRLNIQISPVKGTAKTKKAAVAGALISVRDVTNDFLVQAKYLKALQLLEQRDSKIAELEDKLQSSRSRPG